MTTENPLVQTNKKNEKVEKTETVKPISQNTTKEKVNDVEVSGNTDLFICISKSSSISGNWEKSTNVMEIKEIGCVVKVYTRYGENISEGITFVPDTMLQQDSNGNYKLVKYVRRTS